MKREFIFDIYRKVKEARDKELQQILKMLGPKAASDPEIRDEGFSGSWIEKRPQFSTLLKEAGAKKFDAVVVTDFDRLARPDNLKDLGRIQEVFIEHNVKIVTLSDIIDLSDDDQWFVSSLLGIVAAKEQKKIISRMKRGIEAKKEAGWFYGGIAPSGYQWDGEGKLALRETKDLYHGKKKGQKYICYDWRTGRKVFDQNP